MPIYISFNLTLTDNFKIFFVYFPISFLIADIGLNFITGYYFKGFWINDYKIIAKNYLKNNFIIDIVSVFP